MQNDRINDQCNWRIIGKCGGWNWNAEWQKCDYCCVYMTQDSNVDVFQGRIERLLDTQSVFYCYVLFLFVDELKIMRVLPRCRSCTLFHPARRSKTLTQGQEKGTDISQRIGCFFYFIFTFHWEKIFKKLSYDCLMHETYPLSYIFDGKSNESTLTGYKVMCYYSVLLKHYFKSSK